IDSDHLRHHLRADYRIPATWPPAASCPDALAADGAGVDHREPDSPASLDGPLLRPFGALRLRTVSASFYRGPPAALRCSGRDQLGEPVARRGDLCPAAR